MVVKSFFPRLARSVREKHLRKNKPFFLAAAYAAPSKLRYDRSAVSRSQNAGTEALVPE
jgi:hypothetical protein